MSSRKNKTVSIEGSRLKKIEVNRGLDRNKQASLMSTKRYSTNFSSTVRLNVGGQYFTTTMQTLNKDPNSMLAAMFSGKFEMKPCEDGAFFIDRDGTHFRFILNFLRTGKLILPEGATFLKELEEEAGFYQNQGIIDALRPPLPVIQEGIPTKNQFQESSILKNVEHRRILRGWLPPQQQEGTWRLLFRASRDGFAANTFHSRCDNKGPTVTIAISINGFRFGGFTEESWTSKLQTSPTP